MPTIESMNRDQIVIFGEVLYDCFPDGRRILGGAPFNVAWSLQGLGRAPLFVSSIGIDPDGMGVENKMSLWGMSTDGLQHDPMHETGEVRVTINNNEPSYEICRDRAWDYIQDKGQSTSVLLYHGLLALRNSLSRDTLQSIRDRSPGAIRFFDINLRPPHVDRNILESEMRGVQWLKLNFDELLYLLDEPGTPFSRAEALIDRLRNRFGVENVILTGGGEGAILKGVYGQAACIPAPEPEEFVDTVGAGDAFSAYAINSLLNNEPAPALVEGASRFASRVCGIRGATTREETFYKLNYA